jgi:hypothetical protein
MEIITNNVPRFTIDAYELSEAERKEFDYLNWDKIERGEDSATFFRYKGQLYDLGEFMVTHDTSLLNEWSGYSEDSFFSGIVIRYVDDESVIVGRYMA